MAVMNSTTQNAIDLVLAESLKSLASTKPIDKITIKEITDKAGVIRPTFYNHFQDKYELLEWITVNELFNPVDPLISNGMLKEGVTFILTAMEKEKEFYKKAILLEGQNNFNEIFHRCVRNSLLKYIDISHLEDLKKYSWVSNTTAADFVAHAVTYVVVEWIKGDMSIPVDELTDVYLKFFQGSIMELVKSEG